MKKTKNKLSLRLLSLFLAGALVFNPLMAPLAWANEEPPTTEEETAGEETTQDETPSGDVAGSSTDETDSEEASQAADEDQGVAGDATMETGDAEAEADVETTANTNVDCVEGEVATPDDPCAVPEVTTEGSDCGEETVIAHDNLAEVTDEASASAQTGENEITGAGDASMETGDATASGTIENQVNTNLVILEDGEETEETEEATPGGLIVANNNEGEVENDIDVEASTGENETSDNQGEATIETGDALALANLLNFLNTNIVGSDFEIFLENYLQGHEGEVNLNEIWKEIMEKQGDGWRVVEKDGQFFLVFNNNVAELQNDVDVAADTGQNQANNNGQGAAINTGDATALANIINLVNINILGSDFLIAVFNIVGGFTGDLILPRPEYFINQGKSGSGNGQGEVIFNNDNKAKVDDSVNTTANTGQNQANNNEGSNLIQTGEADSQANSWVVANTDIFLSDWFLVVVNHLGDWLGQIFGWQAPGSAEQPGEGPTTIFHLGPNEEDKNDSDPEEGLFQGVVQNQNEAEVENDIHVSASTGSNQANENGGDTQIKTGKATALANLFDLINLNILGGRWFLGLFNVIGDWTGNIYFAYPDVTVNLSNGSGEAKPGETTHYTLEFENIGHDDADSVWIDLNLPEGVIYINDNSGLEANISGQACSWHLGNLARGAGGSFEVVVQIDPDFSSPPQASVSLWSRLKSKIIPPAHAAETKISTEITATATIATSDPEADLTNNSAAVKTIIYSLEEINDDEGGSDVDSRLPILEISAWNNVGDFVYPGDIVTFEIKIRNTSDVPSFDTYLYQELYNGIPEQGFGAAGFKIGTIEPNKGVILSFGLKLNGEVVLPAGDYHTVAQAFGYAPNGAEVTSNEARTDFKIKWKELASLFEAKATGKEEEILGATAQCFGDEDILPYLLSFLVSSFWLLEKTRRKVKLVKDKKKAS